MLKTHLLRKYTIELEQISLEEQSQGLALWKYRPFLREQGFAMIGYLLNLLLSEKDAGKRKKEEWSKV